MKQLKQSFGLLGLMTALLLIQACEPQASIPDEQKTISEAKFAVIVPGGGTYSRPISTNSEQTQIFFDQGLRFAWGFYFPESIASYQQAALEDPTHPMPYWGMAHAMGPNPNSRYDECRMTQKVRVLRQSPRRRNSLGVPARLEAQLINALFVLV